MVPINQGLGQLREVPSCLSDPQGCSCYPVLPLWIFSSRPRNSIPALDRGVRLRGRQGCVCVSLLACGLSLYSMTLFTDSLLPGSSYRHRVWVPPKFGG